MFYGTHLGNADFYSSHCAVPMSGVTSRSSGEGLNNWGPGSNPEQVNQNL